MIHPYARCSSLVTFPAPNHIPYLCPDLEVPIGPCSGLPPRSLLSDPGHQRLQFPPINGMGSTLCPFCPYAYTSTRQTRTFSVVGLSVWNQLPLALRLLPRVHSDTFYSSLLAVLESVALLSNNLEETLYKST